MKFEGCEKSVELSTLAAQGTFIFENLNDGPLRYCRRTPTTACSNNSDCLHVCTNSLCSNNSAACTSNTDCRDFCIQSLCSGSSLQCTSNSDCRGVACDSLTTCRNNRAMICSTNQDCGAMNQCDGPWLCRGGKYAVQGSTSRTTGLQVSGCTTGLTLGNGSHSIGGLSSISYNLQRGLVTQGDSGKINVTETKIVGNGGPKSAGLPDAGGVVLREGTRPDLGTSTTAGNNCLYDNFTGSIGTQVNSLRTSVTNVDVQKNFWNGDQTEITRRCTIEPETHTCSSNADCCVGAACTCGGDGKCVGYPSKDCTGGTDCAAKCSSVVVGEVLSSRPSACPQ